MNLVNINHKWYEVRSKKLIPTNLSTEEVNQLLEESIEKSVSKYSNRELVDKFAILCARRAHVSITKRESLNLRAMYRTILSRMH